MSKAKLEQFQCDVNGLIEDYFERFIDKRFDSLWDNIDGLRTEIRDLQCEVRELKDQIASVEADHDE